MFSFYIKVTKVNCGEKRGNWENLQKGNKAEDAPVQSAWLPTSPLCPGGGFQLCLRAWGSLKCLCQSAVPSTFSLVCHSVALSGVLRRVSIKFVFIDEGLVERCRERNLLKLLHGWGAVGKGRETQRGPKQCRQPSDSWASVRRLKIQLGLEWVL